MDYRNRKDAGDDEDEEWSSTDKSVETCVMLCDGLNNKYYRSMLKAALKAQYLTDDVVKKLKELNIKESNDVPLVHKLQESIAHTRSARERNLLKQMGVDFITKYTPEEDEMIRTNWEKFSEEYGFKVPLPFILPKYKHLHYPKRIEKIKFVRYLGRGLPLRSLRSIYMRFCHLYRCRRKGSFTKAEDKLILFHYKKGKDSEPISTLSRILGRYKSCIRLRLHMLESRLSGTIKWNKRVIHDVLKSLLEVTGCEKITDLYNQDISKQTWKEVGRKCILNPVAIEKFWKRKLSTQLFATNHIFLNATRIRLISRLHKGNVKTWRDIDWSNIAQDFEGVSPYFLKSVFKRKVLKTCYPNKNWEAMKSNFPGVIAELHHRYIPIYMNEPCDYYLQRYNFRHEKITTKRLRRQRIHHTVRNNKAVA